MIRSYSPQEKAAILREHLGGRKSVSSICKKYGITRQIFGKWRKALLDNGDLIFRQFPQDGMDYLQNYDFVVNWFSEVFRGRTLGVLGIKTAKIRRVCSFKPAEISVNAGIVDVIFEDMAGSAYHLEEQRGMTEGDMYRFGSQHFSVAKEWKEVTDILLISGAPYRGKRKLRTPSGTYAPVFADLTERDGPARLAEIREAVAQGDLSALPELVFLPLYGRNTDEEQAVFVKQVIRFEIGLHRQEKISAPLIAATLIMANKQIGEETFQELWEELKMLNILRFAHEKGMEEGVEKGRKEGVEEGRKEGVEKGRKEGMEKGRTEYAREMILEVIEDSLGVVPDYIVGRVRSVSQPDTLRGMLRQAMKCKKLGDFEKIVELATRKAPA